MSSHSVIAMEAVKKDGMALEHARSSMRNYISRLNKEVLQHADPKLQNEPDKPFSRTCAM